MKEILSPVTYSLYQDQRILELMMMKGEDQISANRDRFIADLAWEEQRKLEEEVKVRTEMKRRQMLAEENKLRDLKKVWDKARARCHVVVNQLRKDIITEWFQYVCLYWHKS